MRKKILGALGDAQSEVNKSPNRQAHLARSTQPQGQLHRLTATMHDRERDREVSLQSIALSSHGISISRLSISSITSLGGLQPNYNIIVVARNELGIGGVSKSCR